MHVLSHGIEAFEAAGLALCTRAGCDQQGERTGKQRRQVTGFVTVSEDEYSSFQATLWCHMVLYLIWTLDNLDD
jgi:hypothetical protein